MNKKRTPPEPEKRYVTPGHLINRIARVSSRWADERFQTLGFAVAQMPVLIALSNGNAMTQKELAERAEIEQPTMAQLLARMERDGLIRRSANPTSSLQASAGSSFETALKISPSVTHEYNPSVHCKIRSPRVSKMR